MLYSRKPSQSRAGPSPAPSQEGEPPLATPRPHGSDSASEFGAARPQSFIAASATVVGDIETEGDVRLDGRICGNVRCAQLIVGKDAAITGAVVAEEAIVRGRIVGTIRAPLVIIQGTAHVESEIVYRTLALDDGAVLEGALRRSDNPLAGTLAEAEAAAALEGLRQLTLPREGASSAGTGADSRAGGQPAAGDGAADAPLAPAPAADGHDTTQRNSSAPHI